MQLSAGWHVTGIVTERRELTSKKNESWRGYLIKVASLGATFELQASPEQFQKVAEGQHLAFAGRFDEQNGRQKLVIDNIAEPPKEGRAA